MQCIAQIMSSHLPSDLIGQLISTYQSDASITVMANIFNNLLLNIDVEGPITSVGTVSCVGVCSKKQTSDATYVCRLQKSAIQANNFLATHFSDYVISDACQLNYTGPVRARQLLIDLNGNNLIFRDFAVACGCG